MTEPPRPQAPADAVLPEGDGGAAPHPSDDLLARLADVERRPLAERAAGYSAVHDELRDVLEGGAPAEGRRA